MCGKCNRLSHYLSPYRILLFQGLAIYCGEDGGERSAPALLQVLSEFAISLESGVKKYDRRVELAKKQAAAAKKQKEQNTRNIGFI